MRISTNWLKDFITLAPPVERIAEKLTMAGLEVKKLEPSADRKDLMFEIEITSNRPDWLSHWGVAREIAAVENLSLKPPQVEKAQGRALPPGWKINLKELEACPYYTGVYIEGIAQNAATPDFMKERLEACGLRSINLIVDITNYVLLETGQPLHAFDADILQGQEIQIRRARAGEEFAAINGSSYKLEQQDLVIADAQSVVALAGVMGGKKSEVTERTRNLFLESAFFHPRWVRMASRRLNLSSDSSYRFERRVDPEGVDLGRDRAVTLIQQYAKPRFISGILKAGQKPVTNRTSIHLSMAEVEKRVGLKIKSHQATSILTRLGLEVKPGSSETIHVSVPSYRPDLMKPVDLVEEIARIYGYDNIPETLPSRPPLISPANTIWNLEQAARNFFSGAGFFETVTFSLITDAHVEATGDKGVFVHNPQNQDLKWMRPSLLPSLLSVIQRNQNQGARRVPLFEIANVYREASQGRGIEESKVIAVALYGNWREKNWLDAERAATFYDLKGAVSAFLESLGLHVTFKETQKSFFQNPVAEQINGPAGTLGFVGEVSGKLAHAWDLESKVFYAEMELPKLTANKTVKFQDMPRYPAIERDLSILVPESVKAGRVEEEIRNLGGPLLTRIELFDLFQGGRVPKGFKNFGFRLIYQAKDKTLLSDEVQRVHAGIAADLAKKFEASFQ